MRFVLLFLMALNIPAHAQPDRDAYRHYVLNHPTLGKIDYHVDTVNARARQPLLLWLDGSGCLPLRMVFTDGKNCCLYFKTVMIDEDNLAKKYHIVLISKPGIPYQAPQQIQVKDLETFNLGEYMEREMNGPRCGPAFNERNSLGWRAGAAAAVLDAIFAKKHVAVDPKRVLVAGHSEGAPVAAKVATLSRYVTHVGCFAGPGLTHFYDFMLTPRLDARAGIISPEAAQSRIDTLLTTIKSIMAEPQATDKFWEGNTYKRWASYAEPMGENLLKLTIPIYVATGTADKNTVSESADILPILFAQRRKANLTYRACPACDHWFNDTRPSGPKHWKEYFNEFLQLANP